MSPAPPGVPRVPPPKGSVPLERGRAWGMLTGLVMFGLGFLAAAIVAAVAHVGVPAYWVAITVGFLGVGVVGFFLNRGTVPLPPEPIWSPTGLAMLARAIGRPARAVQILVYGLIGAGFIGNVLGPMLSR